MAGLFQRKERNERRVTERERERRAKAVLRPPACLLARVNGPLHRSLFEFRALSVVRSYWQWLIPFYRRERWKGTLQQKIAEAFGLMSSTFRLPLGGPAKRWPKLRGHPQTSRLHLKALTRKRNQPQRNRA